MNLEIKNTKYAERLSFFVKENYNVNEFINVQPVSLAPFKTFVMPAALQPTLITSQPFSDCRNSYTFLITWVCSSFKVEDRRATSMVVASRFGSQISVVIAFVKYHWSIFFTFSSLMHLSSSQEFEAYGSYFEAPWLEQCSNARALWWLYQLTELQMHSKVWVLSDHFVIQVLPLLGKNMDQLCFLTGLLSHIRCSIVLHYSLNKIHWGIEQMEVQFFSVNQLKRQYLSSDWFWQINSNAMFIISAFCWNMFWSGLSHCNIFCQHKFSCCLINV